MQLQVGFGVWVSVVVDLDQILVRSATRFHATVLPKRIVGWIHHGLTEHRGTALLIHDIIDYLVHIGIGMVRWLRLLLLHIHCDRLQTCGDL